MVLEASIIKDCGLFHSLGSVCCGFDKSAPPTDKRKSHYHESKEALDFHKEEDWEDGLPGHSLRQHQASFGQQWERGDLKKTDVMRTGRANGGLRSGSRGLI
jgi:hypothetical protein